MNDTEPDRDRSNDREEPMSGEAGISDGERDERLPHDDTEEDTGEGASGESKLTETQRVLEALLFASDEILTSAKLKAVLPGAPDTRELRKMIDRLKTQLQKERHPFEIVELGGGYQMRTISYYYPWVRQLFKEKPAKRLSAQALECLAIIAYKQPLTKAEIESIRGVISDGAMKTLLEKHLVTISGRSDKPGRPLLYTTTQEFLEHFGINRLSDLPQLEEFEAIAREKLDEIVVNEENIPAGGDESPEEDEAAVSEPGARPEAPLDFGVEEEARADGEQMEHMVNSEEAMEIARRQLEELETVEIDPESAEATDGTDEAGSGESDTPEENL
jgi:segregation and condensation protein B